jgi:hypothetical protein
LHAGTPQGIRSGPNNFKLLINDLHFDVEYAKYVDDTTIAAVSQDPKDHSLQTAADGLSNWCRENSTRINTKKKKKMLHFGNRCDRNTVIPLTINGETIERVSTFKLLAVVFSSDLTWSNHVLNKISKRCYIIFQLYGIRIAQSDIVLIYCAINRSVLEYVCAVWHCKLAAEQSNDLERVQKRCMRIIYPQLSYSEALFVSELERLDLRRERITRDLFIDMQHPSHILRGILPLKPYTNFNTRD